MNENQVKILMQYVNSLEQAGDQLEEMVLAKNIAGIEKVKEFMIDINKKISLIVNQ